MLRLKGSRQEAVRTGSVCVSLRLLSSLWAVALSMVSGCSGSDGPMMELLGPLVTPTPGQTAREAFNAHDPDIRRRSIVRLAAAPFGGQEPYRRLYRLLVDDPDATVRAACVKAIGMHGTVDDVGLIVSRLEDQDPFVRWEAAKALQRIHGPDAVGPLISSLGEDSDADVRMAAAEALGPYPQMRVYHALVGALDDVSFGVVESARGSLETLTGYDFGTEASLWMIWAEKKGEKVFERQQPYVWRPYVKPRGWMDTFLFWKQPDPGQPQSPRGAS